jgi:hypothetical protein
MTFIPSVQLWWILVAITALLGIGLVASFISIATAINHRRGDPAVRILVTILFLVLTAISGTVLVMSSIVQ